MMNAVSQKSSFVTRRSTLIWGLVYLLAVIVFDLEFPGNAPTTATTLSRTGFDLVLASADVGVLVVALVVAWVNSVILAVRGRSLIWLVLAVFLFPPFNAVLISLFAPHPPGSAPPVSPRPGNR